MRDHPGSPWPRALGRPAAAAILACGLAACGGPTSGQSALEAAKRDCHSMPS